MMLSGEPSLPGPTTLLGISYTDHLFFSTSNPRRARSSPHTITKMCLPRIILNFPISYPISLNVVVLFLNPRPLNSSTTLTVRAMFLLLSDKHVTLFKGDPYILIRWLDNEDSARYILSEVRGDIVNERWFLFLCVHVVISFTTVYTLILYEQLEYDN